ncbi:uncharacterized protein CCR75_008518 [Bremia lactucae]|uniref:Uncharacterized protein n=1 Tax=Bremia lactucae TaxID=4779 RepID=A0A976IKG2_BRELC|nr:hypothetical protein CCR75_008518 [Bremia lactucae]
MPQDLKWLLKSHRVMKRSIAMAPALLNELFNLESCELGKEAWQREDQKKHQLLEAYDRLNN